MLPFFKMPPSAPSPADEDRKPARLVSTWQAAAEAGEPIAVVRVRDLRGGGGGGGGIPIGRDAWGRPGRPQPVLVSSEVSFARPFAAAAAGDRLGAETVHYGTLSKALLGSLELFGRQQGQGQERKKKKKEKTIGEGKEGKGRVEEEEEEEEEEEVKTAQAAAAPSSAAVSELLWVRMTGRAVDGGRVELPPDQVPLLDAGRLRSLSLSIKLPKASLLGEGVSLTTTACFGKREAPGGGGDDNNDSDASLMKSYARSLRIHRLRVPTLVGVNANERAAKQMVVADVEIDRYDVTEQDIHADIERVVVEAMEASSFETLEALAAHLASKILSDFRIGDDPKPMKDRGWQVKISLEKPIAVPFAECPVVEVKMGADLP